MVERIGQKKMVIGKNGEKIKTIGIWVVIETLDFHRHRIRQLFASKTHQLFTDDFRGHKAL
ncbi:GTPase Era [Vibrio cholerae]|nr:GTPase Era [Vibrio cholerae]